MKKRKERTLLYHKLALEDALPKETRHDIDRRKRTIYSKTIKESQ